MSTPPPRSSVPGKPNETGAVRGGKKRGLLPLWLLLGLLALIALALILYFALHNGTKKAAVVAPVVPVATTAIASPSDVSSAVPPPVDTSSPADTTATTATAPATAASTPAALPTPAATMPAGGNLVGGAGKSAMPATGKDAEPGDTGTVLFAENSSTIDAQGQAVITAAAAALKADKATKAAVTGYTDKVAGAPINDPLSQERADKVAAVLRSDLGAGVTITTSAKGDNDPAATNVTADGRALNRRAVISNVTP